MHRRILALAVLTPALVLAQNPAPGPADARAPVPPLRYESSIPRNGSPDQKPADWKRVNEEVGRLNGHAGHLKSLERDDPGTKPAEKPVPAATGHSHKH